MGCFCKRRKSVDWNWKRDFDSSLKEEERPYNDNENYKKSGFRKIKGNKTSSDNQEEQTKNFKNTFLKMCNDFIHKIKINKDSVKIEFLDKKYTLYENSNVKIQVLGQIENYIKNLKLPGFVNINFENSNPVDDKELKKDVSSLSKSFIKKGVDLDEDYSLFMKEIGGFIVDGKFKMKYEDNKFIYEFVLELKNEQTEKRTLYKIVGVLRLEILFKKKNPYIINANYKKETILFSTIFNILIFLYEDKIDLIIEILEIICKENKEDKTISLNDLLIDFGKLSQTSNSEVR